MSSEARTRYYMRTWGGLGDNVYLRPAVRGLTELGDVWIETPWPEIYEDLPLRFVEPEHQSRTNYPTLDLRHARRNVALQDASRWVGPPPADALEVRPYILAGSPNLPDGLLANLRFHQSVRAPLPKGPWRFDLPDHGAPPIEPPYAVIRPCVVRAEWPAPARNPLPEYVANVTIQLQLRGLRTVSIADVEEGAEWIEPPEPPADVKLHRAELSTRQMLALIRHASIVVGAVGFILPVAIATGTPLLIFAGGHGRTENPHWLTAPWMDTSRTRWLLPDPFCECSRMDHDCPRVIPDFHNKAAEALQELLTCP